MKKIIGFIIAAIAVSSCMKEADEPEYTNNYASVVFINAAPGASAATSGNLFVDNVVQSGSAVAYRSNSGYLSVQPGNRALQFRFNGADSARFVDLASENFEAGKSYTYIAYDTLTTSDRKLKGIRLTDDLSLPTDKNVSVAKVRFLHLAPRTGPVDVTFLRSNFPVGAPVPDSVTVTGKSYIGSNPTQTQIDELSQFNITLPLGFAGTYTIKVKAAGTQNVLATSGLVALTTSAINQSIVTVYFTGGAQGQALGISTFRHYP